MPVWVCMKGEGGGCAWALLAGSCANASGPRTLCSDHRQTLTRRKRKPMQNQHGEIQKRWTRAE